MISSFRSGVHEIFTLLASYTVQFGTTDVSGQYIEPIFKAQAVLEDKADRLPHNVCSYLTNSAA